MANPVEKIRVIKKNRVIKTIGHSTRTVDEFVAILKAHGVTQVVDIRKMPRSRANQQFNYETLAAVLKAQAINYVYMPGLTGLRPHLKVSANQAWHNKSFQAFADYMQTGEFDVNISELVACSENNVTAIMCAEALPWRCHRSLVADALIARGIAVQHLMSVTKALTHAMPDFARTYGTRVTYPLQGEKSIMQKKFKVGDHVQWNSEAGRVSGVIIKIHTKNFDVKGYTHHASKDEPQYEIKSDKTDHVAMHKGSALTKIRH
jgi:hypothetical protein